MRLRSQVFHLMLHSFLDFPLNQLLDVFAHVVWNLWQIVFLLLLWLWWVQVDIEVPATLFIHFHRILIL
jgi:hypothetical protein